MILTPAPGCGKKLNKINFQKLNESFSSSTLSGICSLGAEQIKDCYVYLTENVNVFDIVSPCSKCKYKCDPIINSEIIDFGNQFKIFGSEYKYPDFIEKEFSNLLDFNNPQAFVYFVTDGHKIKIGKTINPNKRKLEIQTGNGTKLFFIALIPCKTEEDSYELESALHIIYSKDRDSGEWFDIKHYINIE